MGDAMTDYYKQERLEKEANNLLQQYHTGNSEEKESMSKLMQMKFKRTPGELERYIK